jgi:hypothetical protein
MTDMIELQISAAGVHGIPAGKPLSERLAFAFRYVREHERDVFWMHGRTVRDDDLFRTAIAAVLIDGSDADRDIIEKSMRPLKMLNAAASGVPVDWTAFTLDDDVLPLMKIFQESQKP